MDKIEKLLAQYVNMEAAAADWRIPGDHYWKPHKSCWRRLRWKTSLVAKNTGLKCRLWIDTETPWEALEVLGHAWSFLMSCGEEQRKWSKTHVLIAHDTTLIRHQLKIISRVQAVCYSHVDHKPRIKLLQWRHALNKSTQMRSATFRISTLTVCTTMADDKRTTGLCSSTSEPKTLAKEL